MSKQATRIGVHGVVRQNGKILLVEHASGPYKGKLGLPGGKIEYGESPEEALRREFQEEVCGSFGSFYPLGNFHATATIEDTQFQLLGLIYRVEDFSQGEGSAELKHGWYDLKDLPRDQLTPFVDELAKRQRAPEIMQECLCRQASPSDLVQLAEMRWDFTLEEGVIPHFLRQEFLDRTVIWLQQGLASGQWVYWVAEMQGKIAAHIFCFRVPKVPSPDHLEESWVYLTNVYTKPAHRNMGIGSALLESVKQWASSEKKQELLLVWPSSQSERFYMRCGFDIPSNLMVLNL
ncbi:MAG: GNAT family N-acetyltransferase [Parachlamydia sp.]|nr:GNAT family N-acetyltransferase [Parachlamydia sp.]